MQTPEYETTAVTPMTDRPALVRRRTAMVFLMMVVILSVALIRMATIASSPSLDGRWRLFVVPSLRGRILDADGRSLAWSTHQFSVTYRRPDSELVASQDLRELQDACGWRAVDLAQLLKQVPESVVVLKDDVAPDAVVRFQKNLSHHPRLKLLHRFKRHRWAGIDERLVIWMGETRQFGWREVGISGLEKKLNRELMTGQDGKILVLVDDDGDWIPGTECRIQEPKPGFDRYVDFRIRQ